MSPAEIDWKVGQVRFWDLGAIDDRLPLADQALKLKEDLAQIEYPSGVILDVGWYPEFSVDGNFIVLVAPPGEWERPLFNKIARTMVDLKERLTEGVQIAVRAIQE